MNRKTLLALATFAVLGLLAIIALRQPEKGERTGDRAAPVPELATADIETIEVTKAGATTRHQERRRQVQGDRAGRLRRRRADRQGGVRGAGQDGRRQTWSPIRRRSTPSSRSTTRAASTWSPRARAARSLADMIDRQGRRARARWSARRARTRSGRRAASRATRSTRTPPTGATRASPPSPPTDAESIEVADKDGGKIVAQEDRRQGRAPRTSGTVVESSVEDRQARQRGPERHRVDAGDLEGERLRRRRQAGRRGSGAAGS